MSTDNVLVTKIEDMFGKLEAKIHENNTDLIKQTARNEISNLDAQQNVRDKLGVLEERLSKAEISLIEADGKLDNLRTETNGELKLVHEILKGLNEKIERIEKSTSKEESIKRTWRIALIAAVPGMVSVVITLVELFG